MPSDLMVFAVGSGRCGSKTMHKFFASQPEWMSKHERHGSKGLTEKWMNYHHPEAVGTFIWLQRYMQETERLTEGPYFEADTTLFALLKDMHHYSIRTRFIVMMRDQDDAVESMAARTLYDLHGKHTPWTQQAPKPPPYLMTRREQLGWYWGEIYSHIFKQLTWMNPSRYTIVHMNEFKEPLQLEEKLERLVGRPLVKGKFDWSVQHNARKDT